MTTENILCEDCGNDKDLKLVDGRILCKECRKKILEIKKRKESEDKSRIVSHQIILSPKNHPQPLPQTPPQQPYREPVYKEVQRENQNYDEEIDINEYTEKANPILKHYNRKIINKRTDLLFKLLVIVFGILFFGSIVWFNFNFGVLAQKDTSINVPVNNENINQNNFTMENNPNININQTTYSNTNMNTSINFINPTFIFYANSSG